MKTGLIVQARMTSERLPGKVLCNVRGKVLLQYLLESLRHCSVDDIIVATSELASDNRIAEFCDSFGVSCARGSLEDVAGRFLSIVEEREYGSFVRICADSPLMDYRIVNRAVDVFQAGPFDLVTNTLERTFPIGQSVEVIRSSVFRAEYPSMTLPQDKEHVTAYFYRNSDRFEIHNFESGRDLGNVRLSVDTPEDLERFEFILSAMTREPVEYTFEQCAMLGQGKAQQ